jgi:hypothetical protein
VRAFDLLVACFALLQLARYARRALLFVLPTLRVSGEESAAPASAAALRAGAELERLGFRRLGVVRRRGPLGASAAEVDAYASPERGAYAEVEEGRPEPRVAFFTPFAGGATVLTACGARRAIVGPRTQVGGIPDAPLEAVLTAHRVAVDRFRGAHGDPQVTASLEARIEAGRRWYAGDGRREVRREAAFPFAIAALSALVLASAVNILLGSAK